MQLGVVIHNETLTFYLSKYTNVIVWFSTDSRNAGRQEQTDPPPVCEMESHFMVAEGSFKVSFIAKTMLRA